MGTIPGFHDAGRTHYNGDNVDRVYKWLRTYYGDSVKEIAVLPGRVLEITTSHVTVRVRPGQFIRAIRPDSPSVATLVV